MQELNKNLQEKLKNLPTNPGVYKMKDGEARVIYVGKAKNLKNRVKSYFQKTDKATRTEKMVEKIEDIEWIEVNSELEAFLLETNLIKQLMPKYNILMKDGKNFTYLKINIQDKYPRIEIVRQLKKDGAKYFGPKLSAKGLQETVRMLQEIYPIVFNNIYLVNSYPKKLDSNKEIKELDGVSQEQYKKAIDRVIGFFQGKYEEIEKTLQEKMMDYAKLNNFESAARLRDMLFEFKKTLEKQIISEFSNVSQDVFGFYNSEDKVYVCLFQVRNGKVIGNENFTFEGNGEVKEILEALISQYYSVTADLPKEVLFPSVILSEENLDLDKKQGSMEDDGTRKVDVSILENFFSENFKQNIKIHLPQKGKKSKLVELAESNAKAFGQLSEEKEGKDKEKLKKAFSEISEAIGIESTFKRIECYDISHFGGTDTVASMVVFTNGIPDKKEYKKFDVKTVKKGEIDDFKSMNEVLTRRLKELENSLKNKRQMPQFEYKKLTKKESVEIVENLESKSGKTCKSSKTSISKNLDLPETRFTFTIYQVVKNTKSVGFITVYKYDSKTFEVDFTLSEFEGEIEDLKKDFFLKMPDIFGEKKVWIYESEKVKKGKNEKVVNDESLNCGNVLFIENGFKKLKTFDGDLEENKGVVPEKIAKNSPNRIKKGMFFFREFGKKAWDALQPNLILIDGGKGQLSSVVDAFVSLGWKKKDGTSIMQKNINGENAEIILASLAKREEEVFLIGESDSINLPNNTEGSFLFQRIRDEAHRFALTFQRGKRLRVLK